MTDIHNEAYETPNAPIDPWEEKTDPRTPPHDGCTTAERTAHNVGRLDEIGNVLSDYTEGLVTLEECTVKVILLASELWSGWVVPPGG